MFNKILKWRTDNRVYYYIVSLFFCYGLWKVYKQIIVSPSNHLSNLADRFNFAFGEAYLSVIGFILKIIHVPYKNLTAPTSYGVFPGIALQGDGQGGIYVAYHCLGVTALIVLVCVLWLQEGAFKRKLKYSLFGVIFLLFLNTFRIFAALLLITFTPKSFFDFNHSVIFVILMYSGLLLVHFMYLRGLPNENINS